MIQQNKCSTLIFLSQLAYSSNQNIKDFMGDIWTYLVYNKFAVTDICRSAKVRRSLGNAHHVAHQFFTQNIAIEYNEYDTYNY